MKRLSVRQVYDVFVVLFFLVTIFFVNGVEAKSLKKGEVYSLFNGRETMEVISDSELEITKEKDIILAKYNFKDGKLRVVADVLGTTMVRYFVLMKEGLMEEKTGGVYYSKAELAVALERQRAEEKRRAEEEKRRAAAEEKRRLTYTDNGDGTITQGTGLMWQKEDDNTNKEWEAAITYCKGLSLGGYSDWRLPTIEELKSIIDKTREKPVINTTYFPNTKASDYWSSTTNENNTSQAWYVDFYGGAVYKYGKFHGDYVRCVRGGQ